ncbi:MAG: Rrf2 family transcriptional regulator [bacterium]|nr:Rrf2 family transcriptional regulator [bacterium]
MKISKKGEYAIRALINLALNYGKGVTQIQDIAKSEDIPVKFLEQILLSLKNAGFLQSKRGKGGGYLLDRSPDKIKLGEIIRLIDGPLAPLACVSITDHVQCSKEATCGLRSVMVDVKDAISEILDHITLTDVCKRIEGKKDRRLETLMYNI